VCTIMRPTTQQNQGVMLQHQQKFAAPPPPQNQTPTKTTKILIGLEQSPQAFNLRSRIIGETGANLHYIRTETGALATLRGRGSMFIDTNTGCESQEPLHLYIEHPTFEGLKEAEHLAKNLVETLQQELNLFQEPNSPKPQLNNQVPPSGLLQQQPQPPSQVVLAAPLSIPPPTVLAVPPPSHIIQSNGIPQTIIHQQQQHQQQAFIQQNPAQMQQQQSQNTIMQQQQPQTIIHQQPQHHISQMHQSMMIPQVQQQTLGNVNLPPPGNIYFLSESKHLVLSLLCGVLISFSFFVKVSYNGSKQRFPNHRQIFNFKPPSHNNNSSHKLHKSW
jgi:hypothetical protein